MPTKHDLDDSTLFQATEDINPFISFREEEVDMVRTHGQKEDQRHQKMDQTSWSCLIHFWALPVFGTFPGLCSVNDPGDRCLMRSPKVVSHNSTHSRNSMISGCGNQVVHSCNESQVVLVNKVHGMVCTPRYGPREHPVQAIRPLTVMGRCSPHRWRFLDWETGVLKIGCTKKTPKRHQGSASNLTILGHVWTLSIGPESWWWRNGVFSIPIRQETTKQVATKTRKKSDILVDEYIFENIQWSFVWKNPRRNSDGLCFGRALAKPHRAKPRPDGRSLLTVAAGGEGQIWCVRLPIRGDPLVQATKYSLIYWENHTKKGPTNWTEEKTSGMLVYHQSSKTHNFGCETVRPMAVNIAVEAETGRAVAELEGAAAAGLHFSFLWWHQKWRFVKFWKRYLYQFFWSFFQSHFNHFSLMRRRDISAPRVNALGTPGFLFPPFFSGAVKERSRSRNNSANCQIWLVVLLGLLVVRYLHIFWKNLSLIYIIYIYIYIWDCHSDDYLYFCYYHDDYYESQPTG